LSYLGNSLSHFRKVLGKTFACPAKRNSHESSGIFGLQKPISVLFP
jgi:hypothetical protein